MLKFEILKSCEAFHYKWKTYSNLFSNPREGSSALEAGETRKLTKMLKKLKKMQVFLKNAKICHIQKLKNNPWQKYYSVTYYQIPKDVFWPLRLERRE